MDRVGLPHEARTATNAIGTWLVCPQHCLAAATTGYDYLLATGNHPSADNMGRVGIGFRDACESGLTRTRFS